MRTGLIFALAVALGCSTSAGAQQIVQSVGAPFKTQTLIQLFDPSLGSLNSVVVDGTVDAAFMVDRSLAGTFPAVSVSQSGLAIFMVGGNVFDTLTLTGTENFNEGSGLGALDLSGSIFQTLTGAAALVFEQTNYSVSTTGFQVAASATPILPDTFLSGSPLAGGGYTLKVTYNYTPSLLPEPSTWAMMLLGFLWTGFGLRIFRKTMKASADA